MRSPIPSASTTAQADEVYLDPMGYILLEGYGYYRTYYRGTLDKLAVDINVFKAGSHKSAPDEWTRRDMSPEDRADARSGSAAVGCLQGRRRRRSQTRAGLIQAYADEAAAGVRATGGDSRSTRSRAASWTRSRRGSSSRRSSRGRRRGRRDGSPRSTGTVPAVRALGSLAGTRRQVGRVVVASGEILDGERAPGLVGGDSLAKVLRDAREDDDIAAVVLRIDSPGGSIMASEVIRREIAALKAAGKPVVASMSTVAASGGYYIAMDADRIYAAPTTITGSIGVFAVMPTFQRTLDKIGITNDGFGTTRLSGQSDLDRELGPMRRKSCRLRSSTTIAASSRASLGAQAPARGDRQPRAGARVDGARTRRPPASWTSSAVSTTRSPRRRGLPTSTRTSTRALDGAGAVLARRAGVAPAGGGGRGGRRRRTAPRRPAGRSRARRARALLALAAEGRPVTSAPAGWSEPGCLCGPVEDTLPDWPPPMVSNARA